MRGIYRLTTWMACVALATAGFVCPAHAAEVRNVRVSTDSARTRVVIDLSGSVEYKLFQLTDPGRVVLDLDDSSLAGGFKSPGDNGVLKDVRTGHHGKNGLRMVLDLKSGAKPSSFRIPPRDGHGYRLVVDLKPDGSAGATASAVADAASREERSARQSANRAAALLQGARKIVVVVDAGHGGVDPGAHGSRGTREKDVTLAVALKLAKLIDKQPGMTAVLTRDNDSFIPLKRRYQIARQNNADLFVSIHADAFNRSDAKGSSVWVLSTHGKVSEAARWLADRQNRADLVGGVSLDDKSDSLASVLLDLQQGYAIQASSSIANNVLQSLAKLGPVHRDHIEHANFVVLRSPDVPSILVETAFITNPVGERNLRSPAYQGKLADAILNGVTRYFESTPPAGTWFALQARKRRGELVASDSMAKAAAANGGDVYKVGRGDTLSGIAHQYGVSVNALKSANNMSDNTVRTGTVLAIPAS